MLKEYFKKEEHLNDYNVNVEVFNKNNSFNIGDKIFIKLDKYNVIYKKNKIKLEIIETKIVEVKVELGLYGLTDKDELFKGITKYEFRPVFIIGDSKVPEMGEEYAERVFWSDFSILKDRHTLPLSGNMRFNRFSYTILSTESI